MTVVYSCNMLLLMNMTLLLGSPRISKENIAPKSDEEPYQSFLAGDYPRYCPCVSDTT